MQSFTSKIKTRSALCVVPFLLGLAPAAGQAQTEEPPATTPAPITATPLAVAGDTGEDPAFLAWLAAFRAEAEGQGISEATLEQALANLQLIPRVLEYDRRQPEFVDTFLAYIDRRLTERRLGEGLDMFDRHKSELADVEQLYGVPSRYLVAFWGLESNYGRYIGDFPAVAALATLAADSRRGEFFQGELLAALRLIDAGHASAEGLLGSWAGAMGQMQFMPSTFMAYAVDGNGDGRKDIWNTVPDALYSAANYLARMGWRGDQSWGREVMLPASLDLREVGLGRKKSFAEWNALGVRQPDGSPLADSASQGALILPQGHTGPAFLVQHNFEVILRWNRSIHYALSVGLLADRLAGLPALRTGLDADNRRMSRDQVIELQERLLALGYDLGEADGIIGSRTRAAVADYQEHAGLPPDGYASLSLLERLQAAVSDSTPGSGKDEAQPAATPPSPPSPPVAKVDRNG